MVRTEAVPTGKFSESDSVLHYTPAVPALETMEMFKAMKGGWGADKATGYSQERVDRLVKPWVDLLRDAITGHLIVEQVVRGGISELDASKVEAYCYVTGILLADYSPNDLFAIRRALNSFLSQELRERFGMTSEGVVTDRGIAGARELVREITREVTTRPIVWGNDLS